MEITSSDDLTDLIKIQLSSLASLISEDGYEFVGEQALQELGWEYPVTSSPKMFWTIKRATRHAIYILLIASANKFKYKLVNLQHRFEHFKALIEEMDAEFAKAIEDNPLLFADMMEDELLGANAYKLFGSVINAGFSYDEMGKDTTYSIDQYITFAPSEEAN
jgi:hypothetical protein